jgi:hypothetical protein
LASLQSIGHGPTLQFFLAASGKIAIQGMQRKVLQSAKPQAGDEVLKVVGYPDAS